jgi:uncharacterized protein YdcH (DUF465 family)
MSHVPHELVAEFPEHAALIHRLKGENAHFAKLFDSYHEVNRQIHRMETEVEPTSDDVLEQLKKQRLHLADELGQMLRQAA